MPMPGVIQVTHRIEDNYCTGGRRDELSASQLTLLPPPWRDEAALVGRKSISPSFIFPLFLSPLSVAL